jgi:hypothetical protein
VGTAIAQAGHSSGKRGGIASDLGLLGRGEIGGNAQSW